ncbi:hypothetical protein [Gaiella sp.]|uniref:hypothetical protein n=1 Tax=Gaiella sp. TaxID=2663207 RepID=UPI002E36DA03|nr:hypothetical protein [Gaiella sp.]HEX5582350.1 hypothetical protein [Gaiella sp.]
MDNETAANKDTGAGEESGPGSSCPVCGAQPVWESYVDDASGEERWLAWCECGQMDALVLGEERHGPLRDPLRAYLFGLAKPTFPETPPWIRLFLSTVSGPRAIRWRYAWQACPRCQTAVRLGMQSYPRYQVFAVCSLCLSCGYVTTSYQLPRSMSPFNLDGAEWFPACPAVQRLRDCTLRPQMVLYTDGWGPTTSAVSHDDGWDTLFGQ